MLRMRQAERVGPLHPYLNEGKGGNLNRLDMRMDLHNFLQFTQPSPGIKNHESLSMGTGTLRVSSLFFCDEKNRLHKSFGKFQKV